MGYPFFGNKYAYSGQISHETQDYPDFFSVNRTSQINCICKSISLTLKEWYNLIVFSFY